MVTEQDLQQLLSLQKTATEAAKALYAARLKVYSEEFNYDVEHYPHPDTLEFSSFTRVGVVLVCSYDDESTFDYGWEELTNPKTSLATLRTRLEHEKAKRLEREVAEYKVSKELAIKRIAELKEKFGL